MRSTRAAVTVRVLRTSGGKVLYVHTDSDTAHAGSPPEDILKDFTDDVQDDLEDN